jgi:hypothetical protein
VTRRKLLLVIVTAALVLLAPATASAVELLEVNAVGCEGISVTGTGLPADANLTLTATNAFSGKALRTVTVTTSAAGAFRANMRAPLAGIAAVEVRALQGKKLVISSTEEFDAAQRGKCAAGTSALPFTGPSSTDMLLWTSSALVGAGLLLRMGFAYRGRHRTRPYQGRYAAR